MLWILPLAIPAMIRIIFTKIEKGEEMSLGGKGRERERYLRWLGQVKSWAG